MTSSLAHQPQHRRADEDAGDDLTEHRGHGQALGPLGGDLRRQQDDEDVDQHLADVHGAYLRDGLRRSTTAATVGTAGFDRVSSR